jgi:hypothetical protein
MQVPKRQVMPIAHPAPASAGAPSMHSTQRFTLQRCAAPLQSDACSHCTHRDVAVSQTGAAIVVHCAVAVHPALHMNVIGSQIGAAVPQSELEAHATHVCEAT